MFTIYRTCQAGLLLAVVFFFCVVSASRAAAGSDDANKYLFICTGDQARTAPDFLAVINFDQESSDYGQVIATVPFATPDASGNEPHHIGLSSDGNVVACGGLLSVLKGQKEIFFFDVSNPAAPKFISAANPPLSAITDEFHALREGGFLVTMMGGPKGHAPGRVVACLDLLVEEGERLGGPADVGEEPRLRPDQRGLGSHAIHGPRRRIESCRRPS